MTLVDRSCERALLALVWGLVPGLACTEVEYAVGTLKEVGADVKGEADTGQNPDAGFSGAGAGPGSATRPSSSGLGAFGAPELVNELSDGDYEASNPTLTDDLLEIYFTTERPEGLGKGDIWVATRTRPDEMWSAPAPVVELNSEETESAPAVAPDGLTIWLSSDRPGTSGKRDIWVAMRQTRSERWSVPVLVPELSSAEDDLVRPAAGSKLVMMVACQVGDPPEWDILMATRASEADPWSTPAPVTEINTSRREVDPFLAADNVTLFFNSNRVAEQGEDLYLTTRPEPTAAFLSPSPISELNSTANERDPWVSNDLRTIFFCSNRSGRYEIYRARR